MVVEDGSLIEKAALTFDRFGSHIPIDLYLDEKGNRYLDTDPLTDGSVVMKASTIYRGIIIAVSKGFHPYMGEDIRGQASGMMIDLWRKWSEKVCKPVDFRLYNLQESLDAVKNGEADIHAGLSKSQDRAEWMTFSSVIYSSSFSLFSHSLRSHTDLLNSTHNLKVGLIQGLAYEGSYRKKFPKSWN